MTKKEAIKNFVAYLRNHNVKYHEDLDNGCIRFTMRYTSENSPEGHVESCIWFYATDSAEVRVYYNAAGADICKKSRCCDGLLRVLNYINARVFLSCEDPYGLYAPHMLYTPRIYLTEDGCYDITITTIVNYDFWKVAPIETCD